MLGVFINVITVIFGSCIGLLLKSVGDSGRTGIIRRIDFSVYECRCH